MELITFKIKPLSSFSTVPKGDTIFGHIVLYDFLNGGKVFANYLQDKPNLIVSDMMPYGYVYKPMLPLRYFQSPNEDEVDKKEIRKRKFITIENLQNGNLHLCEKVDFEKNFTTIRNSINRTTFTTGGDDFSPYGEVETLYFKELWMFVLVEHTIKDRILELITKVGQFGFGKDANIGKGNFEFELIETPIKDIGSNYYMSLSPALLQDKNIQKSWYEPFTRFGKFGSHDANKNVFKKPVLMADSGAVVKLDKQQSYFGKAENNGNHKVSFLQGYSIALPIMIKDENG